MFKEGRQVIRVSDGEMLVDAKVTLAYLGPGKKARRLPKEQIHPKKYPAQIKRGPARNGQSPC